MAGTGQTVFVITNGVAKLRVPLRPVDLVAFAERGMRRYGAPEA